jgi:RimJ/RimL family protein N-acetyltransferase
MNNPLALRAGALTLDPLAEKHTAPMWQAYWESREELRPFLAWVETVHSAPDLERFVARAKASRADGVEYLFAALTPEGEFVGAVGLHNIDRRNRAAEMGFWVRTSFTRRGACQAMAARVLRFAFRELGLHRIFIRHALDNLPSQTVIRKLGFVHEGVSREDTLIAGRWITHETYSMLVAEYDRNAAALLRAEESARL